MIIPSANWTVFISNMNTMFGEAYSTTPIIHPEFVTTYPCTSSQLVFAWTGMMPKFRPWVGPRVTNEPAPQTYTVVPIPYENTFDIDQFHINDDQYGVYYRMIPDMARQARRWEEYELRDLLEGAGQWSGTAQQAGLDGLSNWNTAHPVDLYDTSKGTYINDFTGGGQNVTYTKPTGTVTTLVGGAISPTAFLTLWGYMATLKAEDNESMGVTPNRLMHHPILNGEVQLLLKATYFAPPAWSTIGSQVGAADNVITRFGVEPISNPLLRNAYTWYLMDTTKAIKPFSWVMRDAITIVPRVSPTDPIVFNEHKFLLGGWGRGAPGWAFAWLAARSGP
jgi:phage major head subunit gpT-like protein